MLSDATYEPAWYPEKRVEGHDQRRECEQHDGSAELKAHGVPFSSCSMRPRCRCSSLLRLRPLRYCKPLRTREMARVMLMTTLTWTVVVRPASGSMTPCSAQIGKAKAAMPRTAKRPRAAASSRSAFR